VERRKMGNYEKQKAKKRAAGGIRQLSLTNPLNSQLDTNVLLRGVGKKWNCAVLQAVL
jgi:hypothetical protein